MKIIVIFLCCSETQKNLISRPAITASKSEFWYGLEAGPTGRPLHEAPGSTSKIVTRSNEVKPPQPRPRSAFIPRGPFQLQDIIEKSHKKPIVERGLVKERAKLFEKKIEEENLKMENRTRRPRYCAPTVASKARQRPPLREVPINTTRWSKSHAPKVPRYEEKDEVLVMQIPTSTSGQSGQGWSWSSVSPRSPESEFILITNVTTKLLS